MPDKPKYANIHVPVTGQDGNAFMIIGRVGFALRRAGVTDAEIVAFRQEAMSGDYANVLNTVQKWVTIS